MRRWLIELRKERGLSQHQLASRIGISRSYYSEIEVGTKTPSGRTAKKIADYFGFDMSVFFEENRRKTSRDAS
nr:MAG: XRE family transcriptional regulator [Chloroflexota bacterium]